MEADKYLEKYEEIALANGWEWHEESDYYFFWPPMDWEEHKWTGNMQWVSPKNGKKRKIPVFLERVLKSRGIMTEKEKLM